MREYVEKLIREYPTMLQHRDFLKRQIENYQPITVEDVIDSMTFSRPDGERVQTGRTSDKTCSIAMYCRDKVNRMNEEVIRDWVKEYNRLDEEIEFLEGCVRRLPEDVSKVITVLAFEGKSWSEAERMLFMSRKAIAAKRQEGLGLITLEFQRRASIMEAEMLG